MSPRNRALFVRCVLLGTADPAVRAGWVLAWVRLGLHSAFMVGLPTGTVTFLFTDIEGSTRLLQELGDRYAAVGDGHAAILRRAIREGGGGGGQHRGWLLLCGLPQPAGGGRGGGRRPAGPGRPWLAA